jgi:hypothetical protein
MKWWERIAKRPPDEHIGGHANPIMLRWKLIPHNRFLNIYLHKFVGSDTCRSMHDHPWASLSFILKGCYVEYTPLNKFGRLCACEGDLLWRGSEHIHRIELPYGPCWTLFVTGPKVREWGFNTPGGWVHWKKYKSDNRMHVNSDD